MPYSFFVNESEITGSLKKTLETQTLETEKVVEIVYQPQAVFKVRAVTRCTSTIPGSINIFNRNILLIFLFKIIPVFSDCDIICHRHVMYALGNVAALCACTHYMPKGNVTYL